MVGLISGNYLRIVLISAPYYICWADGWRREEGVASVGTFQMVSRTVLSHHGCYRYMLLFLCMKEKDGHHHISSWALICLAARLCCSGLALVEMFHSSQPSQFILQQKESLQKELELLLGNDGVMLYPSHPQLAPKHHQPLFTPFNFSYTGQSLHFLVFQ